MIFNLKKKKFSIKFLLPMLIVALFLLTGIIFGVYLHLNTSKIVKSSLEEKGLLVVKNLAEFSKNDVYDEKTGELSKLADKSLTEKDVVLVTFIGANGSELVVRKKNQIKLKLPLDTLDAIRTVENPRYDYFEYEGEEFLLTSSSVYLDTSSFEMIDDVPESYVNKTKEAKRVKVGSVVVVFSLEQIRTHLVSVLWTVILFIVLITSIGILLSMILIKAIVRPIDYIVAVSEQIADGDLTKTVERGSFVEFDGLSDSINTITGKLREIVNKIFSTSEGITNATDAIEMTSKELSDSMNEQSASIDSSSNSVMEMNEAMQVIVNNIQGLSSSAGLTSSAMSKIVSSIKVLTQGADKLSESIDNSSSSIIEMNSSIKEIANNADELSIYMKNTTTSTKEIDKTIHLIADISQEACSLSERVKTNASESGLRAVEKMSARMDKIKESVGKTAATIKELGKTTDQIGEILTVIEDVTEQTSLLALNAAILAAQAGKHGKGFAVVADEIKALADRTAKSTRQITDIIQGVQTFINMSIKAANVGLENVNEGVTQTKDVVYAFESIHESADISLKKTTDIMNYSTVQAKQIDAINDSTEKMALMVFHVVKATNEQKNASEHIMKMTESISDITTKTKTSIFEQSEQSNNVSKAINDIINNIDSINTSISAEARDSKNIVAESKVIKEITARNINNNNELLKVVRRLQGLSGALKEELQHFKI